MSCTCKIIGDLPKGTPGNLAEEGGRQIQPFSSEFDAQNLREAARKPEGNSQPGIRSASDWGDVEKSMFHQIVPKHRSLLER
jgi:hypothetical protein